MICWRGKRCDPGIAFYKTASPLGPPKCDRGFPDGVAEIDVFYEFAEGPNMATILQFRNGRMVNFDPKEFQESNILVTALKADTD